MVSEFMSKIAESEHVQDKWKYKGSMITYFVH